MPGISVATAIIRSGPPAPPLNPSGQLFVVGITERGPVDTYVDVRSYSDVEAAYGPRVSYGALHDQLKTYFGEGGERALVGRVVGPSTTVGTLTLDDGDYDPEPTLRVDAANPGAWSANLTVQVSAGAAADTFRITVALSGQVVQSITNLATPAQAVTRFAASPWIRLVDLASSNADPTPAVLSATALSAGTDDRDSITTDDYIDALDLFDADLGDGAVAIPGQTESDVWSGVDAHCQATSRIGLLAAARTADVADLLSRAGEVDSEYVGLFAPWVVIPDGAGGQLSISPEGYVAACRARAHAEVGPWREPAGQIAIARTLLDVDVRLKKDDADTLHAGQVSVIRVIASNTLRLYGWRSLSSDPDNYWSLKDRDLLNYLTVQAQQRLEKYLFEAIDGRGQLLAEIGGDLESLCTPVAAKGGLFAKVRINTDGTEDEIDPGFTVDTGSVLNTPESLATNMIQALLLVRVSPSGEVIAITIVKSGADALAA